MAITIPFTGSYFETNKKIIYYKTKKVFLFQFSDLKRSKKITNPKWYLPRLWLKRCPMLKWPLPRRLCGRGCWTSASTTTPDSNFSSSTSGSRPPSSGRSWMDTSWRGEKANRYVTNWVLKNNINITRIFDWAFNKIHHSNFLRNNFLVVLNQILIVETYQTKYFSL